MHIFCTCPILQWEMSRWLNSSAALVYSQLVFLLPVGILNMLSLFQKVECVLVFKDIFKRFCLYSFIS